MNEDDRFAKPVIFPSGVRWEPTDYKPIDQTVYLEYLNRNSGHHWNDSCCLECGADISWCDDPPREKNTSYNEKSTPKG